MNESRQQLYLNLINHLLTCDGGEEGEILRQNQGLIDADLVLMMERVVSVLEERDAKQQGEWLQELANRLAGSLGMPLVSQRKERGVYRQVRSLERRFGKGHLYFAYHAAFPLALTPDLCYQIWANFQRDIGGNLLNIPWIAVADLFLSGLCHPVGHELYEMDLAVRNLLLKELELREDFFGKKRIEELSAFMLEYVREQINSEDEDVRDFATVQKWTALAYVKPDAAARELALTLREKVREGNKAELVRLSSVLENLAEPLRGEYEPLLVYGRGMGKLARGDSEDASREFQRLGEVEESLRVSGVKLPIPSDVGDGDVFGDLALRLEWQEVSEKRRQEYLDLMELLLDCSAGEEGEILRQHQHLVDSVLLDIMWQVARSLMDEGKERAAEFLLAVADTLLEAFDLARNDDAIATFELDRLLEQLLLEARQYPRQSRKRKAAITRLWNGMIPSNSKRRSLLPGALDAKNRLGRTKSSLRNKYGEELKNAFEDWWLDNLQAAQLEFLQKIDIYNLGVDYLLFKHWQDFFDRVSQRGPRNNEELQQDYQWFNQKVEEFSRRFVKRQQKHRRLNDEGAMAIAQTCQRFSDSCWQAVTDSQVDLQAAWDNFCRELQPYYTPKSVWNWFEYILRNCFENSVWERRQKFFKEVSGDVPIAYNVDSGDRLLTLFETLASPDSPEEIETNLPKPKELVDLLVENPYGIFSSKHLKGYPDITFREVAISKTQDLSWDAIEAKFGKQASGTRTISPFYSRNKKYFEPIIKEYLAESFPLPPETLSKIDKDSDRRFAKRKMKQHQQVNFQDLVRKKATGETWEKVAADFGVDDIKSLIVFYLDNITAFQLAKKRNRKTPKFGVA